MRKYPHINIRKLFRKLTKKIKIKLFGYCYVHGCNFKMKKGWQNNPDWDPDESLRLTGNSFIGCTKPWIYYECKRCGAHGEKVKV